MRCAPRRTEETVRVPSDIGVRAFGHFTFRISADDARIAAYLARLYDAFPHTAEDNGALVHEIVVTTDERGDGQLLIDGTPMGADPRPSGLIGTLVHTLTRRMLDECDALGLHAGGVRHNGVGVALPAPMEHGKTTLTAGLVRAGFDYLTDEAVLLDWERGDNIPFPKPLSIDPGSWPLFPELEPHADLLDDGYKDTQWQVAPSDIRADVVGDAGPIQYFVFPNYSEGATTTLTPMRRGEGVIELAKNTFRFNERAHRSLDRLTTVARDADLYRLEIGDLETAVELVTELAERAT
jgi:hypothetical protein